MDKTYWVYVLASRSRNLYTGVTNNLHRRLIEHREGLVPGFTSRYRIFRLVHYEAFHDIRNAIAREKEIKAWRREKKIRLIEHQNPAWDDLSEWWFENKKKQRAEQTAPENTKGKTKADPSRRPPTTRPGSG
jgi:putative endonuclease